MTMSVSVSNSQSSFIGLFRWGKKCCVLHSTCIIHGARTFMNHSARPWLTFIHNYISHEVLLCINAINGLCNWKRSRFERGCNYAFLLKMNRTHPKSKIIVYMNFITESFVVLDFSYSYLNKLILIELISILQLVKVTSIMGIFYKLILSTSFIYKILIEHSTKIPNEVFEEEINRHQSFSEFFQATRQ